MSELAILGGSKTRTEPYPQWPVWDQRDIDAVTEVIKSGRWGGYPYPGPKTAELAKKFAELQGGGYAVPMTNGTITMEVALRAAGIGWGDEVIVPAYTFQATASAPMGAESCPFLRGEVVVGGRDPACATARCSCLAALVDRHHRVPVGSPKSAPARSASSAWRWAR